MSRKGFQVFATCLALCIFTFFPQSGFARKKINWSKAENFGNLAGVTFLLGAARTLQIYDGKEKFDSILPIFKLEGNYQNLLRGNQGGDLGAELGIAFLGGDVQYTRYLLTGLTRDFDIFSTHFLYRLGLIKEAQLNLAIGYKKFLGDLANNSLDFGAPLYLFPAKRWTIEFKPFFSFLNNTNVIVYDLEGGLRYKYKLIGLELGYRWIRVGSRNVNGPRFGTFFEW